MRLWGASLFIPPQLAIEDKVGSFVDEWMEREIARLSEIGQTQKDKGCVFSLLCEI